jgi:hypothetical protein
MTSRHATTAGGNRSRLLTVDGTACRLVDLHPGEIVYVQHAGWHYWDGAWWNTDYDGTYLKACVRRTAESIRRRSKLCHAHPSYDSATHTAALAHISYAFYLTHAPCAATEIIDAAAKIPDVYIALADFDPSSRDAR